ncbi:MAG: DUF1540 domain-containing protein [Alicyclobacillaceae bacterium]|nr:DUF1540 domain-containing protein [Alicyclobacillaceae bacterium]
MPGVRCLVEECMYNDHRGHCTADEIVIATNGNAIAGTIKGTMCSTFDFDHHTNRYGDNVSD